MATYSLKPQQHEVALGWTIGLSIILHLLALLTLPSIHIEKEPPEPELVIELAPIKKVEPPQPITPPKPEATPEPVKPEPIKPEPKIKSEPTPIQPKVTPSPEPVVKAPQPTTKPSPEVTTPPVMAAEPKAEATPVVTVPMPSTPPTAPPAPQPPSPEPAKAEPSQADIDAAKNQYGSALARELAKHKQYPKIAAMRGWEGEVVLELQLDANGNVVSSKVHDSSTFDALDKQALEMVKKAKFPAPPEALRGRSFNVLVPVSFKLE